VGLVLWRWIPTTPASERFKHSTVRKSTGVRLRSTKLASELRELVAVGAADMVVVAAVAVEAAAVVVVVVAADTAAGATTSRSSQ
jgi:hypothetical protein